MVIARCIVGHVVDVHAEADFGGEMTHRVGTVQRVIEFSSVAHVGYDKACDLALSAVVHVLT